MVRAEENRPVHDDPHILILVCQGACGLVDRTGSGHTVGWAGSYEVTPNRKLVGGSRQVIMRTALEVRQPDIGSGPPPRSACRSRAVFERFSCDEAFQTAHALSGVLPFVTASGHIRLGVRVSSHSGEHDPVEGRVGLTVTRTVQSVPSVCFA
jgi:hypothetical protein